MRWSLEALAAAGAKPLIVVIAPGDEQLFRAAVAGAGEIRSVLGGSTRTASVKAGLAALLAEAPDVILIHDAARPGLTPSLVRELTAMIETGADGAAPALPVSDSLRRVDALGRVIGAADRTGVMRVQTPQAFRYAAINAAYAALPGNAAPTDDIAVALDAGLDVRLVPGDPALMKLTFAEDIGMLERVLGETRVTCVGSGFDAHRFGEGDHVMLCGVRIAHERGLLGHSDADAGWHALVDAILGALGAGDIGAHFPPSDPRWKGVNSEVFLRHAVLLAAERGARIQHVDITLICERPKIGPHRDAMRERTAAVVGLPLARVSVKATTTERMGFAGREEGLAAQATATLECVR